MINVSLEPALIARRLVADIDAFGRFDALGDAVFEGAGAAGAVGVDVAVHAGRVR